MTKSSPPVVLVVEDHADTREMYAQMLSASGFDALDAANGEDGLTKAATHPPSIVLTDLRMPGDVSALDVCRHFRAKGVPVIVMTGVGPGPEQDEARRAGCTLLVMKPLAPNDLVRHVRDLLRMPQIPALRGNS
jgi:DNA-binding response OmpR family regulator